MRRMRRNSSEEDGIDISPLIDVVFILLIFFMVSTTFVKDAQLVATSIRSISGSRRYEVSKNID